MRITGEVHRCRRSHTFTISSISTSVKPTSIRCGGKIGRSSVPGARVRMLIRGGRTTTVVGGSALWAIVLTGRAADFLRHGRPYFVWCVRRRGQLLSGQRLSSPENHSLRGLLGGGTWAPHGDAPWDPRVPRPRALWLRQLPPEPATLSIRLEITGWCPCMLSWRARVMTQILSA